MKDNRDKLFFSLPLTKSEIKQNNYWENKITIENMKKNLLRYKQLTKQLSTSIIDIQLCKIKANIKTDIIWLEKFML